MTILKKFIVAGVLALLPLHFAMAAQKTYPVTIGKFKKDYPVYTLSPKSPVSIVYVNYRQEIDLIRATVDFMQPHVQDVDVIVAPGDKANILVAFLADKAGKPFIILTNKTTPDMGAEPLSVSYASITSGDKKLYMSSTQAEALKGKKIAIVDDVLSTGGTMRATASLVEKAGGKVQKILVGFTEEVERENLTLDGGTTVSVVKAGHLPVFPVAKT
jgi:adenine phosphoribosyltransferase